MQNKFRNVLMLFVLATFCLSGGTAIAVGQKQVRNRRQPKRPVATHRAPAWEYKVTGGISVEEMNKLGAEGWELTGIQAPNIDNLSLYFKRRKR
jgi:hypothetical protein